MLIVLSPAKTIDFSIENNTNIESSTPAFVQEAEELVGILQQFKPEELSKLMKISAKLADLNYERFLKWDITHDSITSKPAVFAFKGEVYVGLDAKSLMQKELEYLNKNLRILSGLYGVLKPFDLLREYRLEMGTKLENSKGKNLYKFWGNKIALKINSAIDDSIGEKVLINLASNEYFKSIDKKAIKYPVITPVFKELKDDKYKVVSFFAKKARGLMTRYIAQNNITEPEQIKTFNLANYSFNEDLSSETEWVFSR